MKTTTLASSVAGSLCIGACSLVLSYDGVAGPPSDAGVDGSNDAPLPVVTAADGQSDGGTEASLAYCLSLNPAPLFCDDFDEGSATTGWDTLNQNGGSVSLGTSGAVSPPAYMKVVTNANDANNAPVSVAGYRAFPQLAGQSYTATLAYDLRVDAFDSRGNGAVIAGLQIDKGNDSFVMQFELTPSPSGGVDVNYSELYSPATGSTSYVSHPVTALLALQTWKRVVMTLIVPAGGGSSTATLSFDGTSVQSETVNMRISGGFPVADVGATFVRTPSSGWSMGYDNVTFDAR